MEESSLAQRSMSYIYCFWLMEDWQACKCELSRFKEMESRSKLFGSIVEDYCNNEESNCALQDLERLLQSLDTKYLTQKFIRAGLKIKLLRSKSQLGDNATKCQVQSVLSYLLDEEPTPELIENMMFSINNKDNYLRAGSIEEWLNIEKEKNRLVDKNDLLAVVDVLNQLSPLPSSCYKAKILIADRLFSIREFIQSNEN